MKRFIKDINIGVFFVLGMLGFLFGEFIVSSILLAVASITSNIKFYRNGLVNSEAL